MGLNSYFKNSFRHAFKNNEDPKITIKVTEEKGVIEFVYTDNGKGIEQSETHNKPHKGLSLLQRYATENLKGKLEFENKNGIVYKLTFKNNDEWDT